jgi:V8-like Glu-specific endopeptidase
MAMGKQSAIGDGGLEARRTRTWLLAVALSSLAACGGEGDAPAPPAEPVGREGAISDGKADSGHPEVGKLSLPGGSCSSTLIGRKTLLTAAHCVDELPETFTSGSRTWTVASAVGHPDYTGKGVDEPDVAIVHLSAGVTGIRPALLAQEAPSVGEAITLVGYGFTGTSGITGVKYVGTNVIGDVGNYAFAYSSNTGSQICSGDSGGPSFVTRTGKVQIAGVHSSGTGTCGGFGEGFDIRVDALHDWIAQEAGGDLYTGGFIDVTAPRVSFVSPSDGDTLSTGSIEVQVSASDAVGVVKVVLEQNQAEVGTLTSAPYTFQLDGLKTGTHVLTVVAYDAEGNDGTATATVVVDLRKVFGEACTSSGDCKTELCSSESSTGFCTASCYEGNPCPNSYVCKDTICAAPEGGGCSLAPSASRAPEDLPASGLGLLLAVLLVALGGRERARRAVRYFIASRRCR